MITNEQLLEISSQDIDEDIQIIVNEHFWYLL